jgi:hypothetical protein
VAAAAPRAGATRARRYAKYVPSIARFHRAKPASNRRRGKKLKLYVDPTGRDGIEFPTSTGPIDILAIDESGGFFVFELKRARSPDRAIGQVARYMGWVRQTIGRDKLVQGIIVAKEISEALRYAVSVVPNVSLFEYQVEFRLRRAHDLP